MKPLCTYVACLIAFSMQNSIKELPGIFNRKLPRRSSVASSGAFQVFDQPVIHTNCIPDPKVKKSHIEKCIWDGVWSRHLRTWSCYGHNFTPSWQESYVSVAKKVEMSAVCFCHVLSVFLYSSELRATKCIRMLIPTDTCATGPGLCLLALLASHLQVLAKEVTKIGRQQAPVGEI